MIAEHERHTATSGTDTEWHTGRPRHKGWYLCRIGDEELRLYYFICEMNNKKQYWNDETGARIDDEDIEWREE